MMRLFAGLGLSAGAEDALRDLVRGLNVHGQLTDKLNYHLTLAFLGAREERQAPPLHTIIAAAAKQHPPQTLAITGLGFFGRRESALLYARLAPAPQLSALADTLRGMLDTAGETYDAKPFVAHITLARRADLTAVNLHALAQPIEFTADAVTLYNSARVQGMLRYRPVFAAPLRKDAETA